MKKVVFLGTKEIGYVCLRNLLSRTKELDCEIVAVLTNSRKLTDSSDSIQSLCKVNGIQVLDSLDEYIELPQVDVAISVQYHQILKKQHISKAKTTVNLHMAPLPEYRGCNQFSFAILDDAKEFGTTFHLIDEGIDSGDILFESRFPISSNENVVDLYKKTYDNTLELFKNRITDVINGNFTQIPQSSLIVERGTSTHYRSEMDKIKQIDLSWSKEKIDRVVRATYFPPFPPPYAIVDGVKKDFIPLKGRTLNT